jgi:hypothetical protein
MTEIVEPEEEEEEERRRRRRRRTKVLMSIQNNLGISDNIKKISKLLEWENQQQSVTIGFKKKLTKIAL